MRAVFFVVLLLPFVIPVLVDDAFAAEGDITAVKTQSEGNNLEHDTDRGKWNSLVQVDSDTYALAYKGKDKDGFISTFTISSDGTTITKVDTLEHDTVLGEYNSLVQVDSDTYALAYRGAGEDGFISTFTIDSDGNITAVRTQSEGNNLEHDTNAGSFNSLVQVDSDTYALAYAGTGDNGFISTFTIDSDGVITPIRIQDHTNHASASANLEHDTSFGTHSSLIHVDSDTYALAYRGTDSDGFISTFTISSDGTTITELDNLEHNTELGWINSLIQVDSDTIALAYTGSNDQDGFISTFTIDSDGNITAVNSLEHVEHGTEVIDDNHLVHVDSDTYALAYSIQNNSGYISTFTISDDGSTITELDNLEHDTAMGSWWQGLVKVDSDTIAYAYHDVPLGYQGYIATFTIGDTSTDDSTSSSKSGGCGFDRDCTAPRITKHGISETPDGFSINNVIFEENQKFYNENPTVEIGIGELTTIKTRAWENMGPEKIFLAIAYLDMQGTKPDWRDSKAYIEYDIKDDNITIHDENKMFLAQASTEIVKDPYGDNQGLEFLDITFSLMFTKPMETSHVAIQVVDHIRNYELVYFKDALKVVDRPISEMPEFPGKIEKANTTPKHDEDIHFVLAVNGTEDTIFAAVDGDAIPLEEMNKEEPKIETPEERDARYHLKAKQSEQYERLLEYIAESQAKYPDAWNKIVGSDNVSNQMEHVTDGTKTNVVKNDRRR